MKELIVKVRKNKTTGQKTVTIPKEEKEINSGDYVKITKLEEKNDS